MVALCGMFGKWMLTLASEVSVAPFGSMMSIALVASVGCWFASGMSFLLKKWPVLPSVSAIVFTMMEGGPKILVFVGVLPVSKFNLVSLLLVLFTKLGSPRPHDDVDGGDLLFRSGRT